MTTIDELWAQFWAEHKRACALLAMLPCWEMFEMDETELFDALCNGEMIATEMHESNKRGLAILDEIDKQEKAIRAAKRRNREQQVLAR